MFADGLGTAIGVLADTFADEAADTVKGINDQANLANQKGTVWYALQNMAPQELIQFLEEGDTDFLLSQRCPLGATPMLLAGLFGKLEHVKAIINQYPYCAVDQYDLGTYLGENILHILLARRDEKGLDAIKWIFNTLKAKDLQDEWIQLLKQQATGEFFTPEDELTLQEDFGNKVSAYQLDKNCYFGKLPLSHAVSSNYFEAVHFLIESGADLYAQDDLGNSCFHMAVCYEFKNMCSALLKLERFAKEKNPEEKRYLFSLENNVGQTPLFLAVSLNKQDVFDHLMANSTAPIWTWGPVHCKRIGLSIIDPLIAKMYGTKEEIHRLTVLELLTAMESTEAPRHAIVDYLIKLKWELFARREYIKLFSYSIVLALFFGLALSFRPPQSVRYLTADVKTTEGDGKMWIYKDAIIDKQTGQVMYEGWKSIACVVFKVIVFLFGMRLFSFDFSEIWRVGFERHFFSTNMFTRHSNRCNALIVLLIILIFGATVAELPLLEDILMVLLGMTIWFNVINFFSAHKGLGGFWYMLKEMMSAATSWVLFCIFLILMFTNAVLVLLPPLAETENTWFAYFRALSTIAIVGWDPEFFSHEVANQKFLLEILGLAFVFITGTIMTNVVVAVFMDKYVAIQEHKDEVWLHEFQQLVIALEENLNDAEIEKLKSHPKAYWAFTGKEEMTSVEPFLTIQTFSDEWANGKDEHAEKLESFLSSKESTLSRGTSVNRKRETDIISGVKKGIQSATSGAVKGITSGISKGASVVGSGISEGVSVVGSGISEGVSVVGSGISEGVGGVTSGVKDLRTKITRRF